LIDEVIRILEHHGHRYGGLSARVEGLPVGISSGAALAAGIEVGSGPRWPAR